MEFNTELASIFNYNQYSVNKNFEEINNDESLYEPMQGGNSMNWVLGHIIVNRDGVLNLLGMKNISTLEMEKIYIKVSRIKEDKESVDIQKLLKMFNDSQEILTKALISLDTEKNKETLVNIAGYAFHESYHAGQLGILRRVMGKEGKHRFE